MSEGLDLFSSDEAITGVLARRHWLILPPPEAEQRLPLISLPPLATPEHEVLALSLPYPPV